MVSSSSRTDDAGGVSEAASLSSRVRLTFMKPFRPSVNVSKPIVNSVSVSRRALASSLLAKLADVSVWAARYRSSYPKT